MMSNTVHSCDSSEPLSAAEGTSTLVSSPGESKNQAIIDGLQTEIAALKEQHKLAMEDKHGKLIRAQDNMIVKSKSFNPTTSFQLFSDAKTYSLLEFAFTIFAYYITLTRTNGSTSPEIGT